MRLAVSVGMGLAALFFLFPSLVGFFSGSIIVVALFVGALRVIGIIWRGIRLPSGWQALPSSC